MIEFVFVSAFLVVLMAFAFDFSLFLQEQSIMTDAARTAGRTILKVDTSACPDADCETFRTKLILMAQDSAKSYMTSANYALENYLFEVRFFRESSGNNFVSVHVRHASGRRFIFVPGLVGVADQSSTFIIRTNLCPAGTVSC